MVEIQSVEGKLKPHLVQLSSLQRRRQEFVEVQLLAVVAIDAREERSDILCVCPTLHDRVRLCVSGVTDMWGGGNETTTAGWRRNRQGVRLSTQDTEPDGRGLGGRPHTKTAQDNKYVTGNGMVFAKESAQPLGDHMCLGKNASLRRKPNSATGVPSEARVHEHDSTEPVEQQQHCLCRRCHP